MCRVVSEMTSRRWSLMTVQDRVTRLNTLLQGWANYFSLGTVSRTYRAIATHVSRRLRRWLRAKHGFAGAGTKRFADEVLYRELGLVNMTRRRGNLPWAIA